jgi:hypothetical protein
VVNVDSEDGSFTIKGIPCSHSYTGTYKLLAKAPSLFKDSHIDNVSAPASNVSISMIKKHGTMQCHVFYTLNSNPINLMDATINFDYWFNGVREDIISVQTDGNGNYVFSTEDSDSDHVLDPGEDQDGDNKLDEFWYGQWFLVADHPAFDPSGTIDILCEDISGDDIFTA